MPPNDKTRPHSGAPADQPGREVYFEFHQVGRNMRVCAVDAETGIEVVIMGPVSATQNDLQNIALRKLEARLEQQRD